MALNTLPRYEENRDRARTFVKKWQGERRERAEKDSFWNDFLLIFGVERRQVARFEAVVTRYSTGRHGFIDLFWPGRLLVEHKSAGEDLEKAMRQALDYLPGMDENDVPAVVVVCDFEHFLVHDMDTGTTERFLLNNLPMKLELFGLLEGRDRRSFDSDEDVNLAATEHIARFGEVLEAHGYPEHQRRVLLTRIVFCLFADDAGVWPLGAFEDFLRLRTRPDGSDLGAQLAWLFQVLDRGDDRRAGLPQDMLDFTYVNGGIFAEQLEISQTDQAMRDSLLKASRFNWSRISPAIFGSMFQNVMSKEQRRNLGAHYTSEKNILKLIRPLFLDDLEAELAKARTPTQLRAFRDKLATLTFFDPACGCGNFLIVTYLHLRRLETECLVLLKAGEAKAHRIAAGFGQQSLDVAMESKIRVSQFFGIEIDEWPCRIAEVAMHIAAHLADRELSSALGGGYYAHFPIEDVAKLHNGNALTTDWNEVLPAEHCNYVMGNPPFVGGRQMSEDQVRELKNIWGVRYNWNLDYVSCWYARTLEYLEGRTAKWAFVSTNSVCQGEAVPALWRAVFKAGWSPLYAHRSFRWKTEARKNAAVHVSIVGFDRTPTSRRLWVYNEDGSGEGTEQPTKNINPYLIDANDVLVDTSETPQSGLPEIMFGNMPRDGGHLVVKVDEVAEVRADPVAARFLREYIGSDELLNGKDRWCLWLNAMTPGDVAASPVLRQRVTGTRDFRAASKAPSTQGMARTPHLFAQRTQPAGPILIIPRVFGQNRRYIPAGRFGADVIASDAVFCGADADGLAFAIISSAMFMTWQRMIGGRLKSDLRFSKTLTYNSFPLPSLSESRRSQIIQAGHNVLAAREQWPEATLASLYDPLAMPVELLRAHDQLDRGIDLAFGVKGKDELTRQRALLARYQDHSR